MKHTPKIVFVLVALFLVSQIFGLAIYQQYNDVDTLPLNIERPETSTETSFIWIFALILLATVVAMALIKFQLFKFWKFWFLMSIFLTLTISFNAFIPEMFAILLAGIFAVWKIFKDNVYVHNFTELFIYGALAVVFAPLLSVVSVFILLSLISVYDYIAVRKTKHMVKLAKTQSKAKIFAGLLVPYKKGVAILGGGDIGFPLIFSAVVMSQFSLGLLDWKTYIIPVCCTLMLLALFVKGDKRKYYPAMPYLTLGCILGLGIVLLFI
ncbi:hypothetical protein HN681_02835 [archaeon]|jgi:presenilin-like A22 family membrane protease|nr:hypothetical protein [archaeon]MBT3731148.1 hypothetical protein [archaeon]MBT4670098.1 hypothetical protein [archaeon]MBT5030602.1 hypothetical protein [archaeon]MBT5287954.1 hypothetical protein [archaeon]